LSGITENLIGGGLQGYQNPNYQTSYQNPNYQTNYQQMGNVNNLPVGSQGTQGNALNLNPSNFSNFPTYNQGYNPKK